MLRISKLTDYGTIVLASLVERTESVCSAADIAQQTGLAAPTVSKLLKLLAKADLVTSTRGASGGYRLARPAAQISAADIIDALEGPLSITECSAAVSSCEHEENCNTGGAWQRINHAIRQALSDVSLPDLARGTGSRQNMTFGGMPITIERKQHGNGKRRTQ